MKKKIIFLILILLGVFSIFWFLRNQSEGKLFEVMEVPGFEFTDQNENQISDEDMLGKVYVVEFFFTNCPTICPVMNRNLKEVEKEINDPDFALISITIDPKRDTPQALKEHQQKLGIKNENWHFLTGKKSDILDLSKKFNIYVGNDENSAENLNHSGKIALIDRKGKIRSRYDENGIPILYYSGLNYKNENGTNEDLAGEFHPQINWLKEDIQQLLAEN
jgi:protein SCO1/2